MRNRLIYFCGLIAVLVFTILASMVGLRALPATASTACSGIPAQTYFTTNPVPSGESTFVSITADCISTYQYTYFYVPSQGWVFAGDSNAYGLFTTPAAQQNGGVYWGGYACDASGCSQWSGATFMTISASAGHVGNCIGNDVTDPTFGETVSCYAGTSSNGVTVWYHVQQDLSPTSSSVQSALNAIGDRYTDTGLNNTSYIFIVSFQSSPNGSSECLSGMFQGCHFPSSGGDDVYVNLYYAGNPYATMSHELDHATFDPQASIHPSGSPDGTAHCASNTLYVCYPMSEYTVHTPGN